VRVLLPSELTGEIPGPEQPSEAEPRTGELVVVGLGPGQRSWTTPEVAEALSRADDLVGYISAQSHSSVARVTPSLITKAPSLPRLTSSGGIPSVDLP